MILRLQKKNDSALSFVLLRCRHIFNVNKVLKIENIQRRNRELCALLKNEKKNYKTLNFLMLMLD